MRSRSISRLIAWLETLRADAVFGWRQLRKHAVTSAAAVLSLALAIGACTSAFRLIDAVLLRPLPVAHPEQLYAVVRQAVGNDGKANRYTECEYPLFQRMRTAAGDRAELLAISAAEQTDLTYGADQDTERAFRQYVSGWMFTSFGLKPALGRLFTDQDDRTPGAHPYAVLSHDYWSHRFGQDPAIIGRTFRSGDTLYEIVGVAEAGFTGTDTGTVTDVFIPSMMHPGVTKEDWSWFRTWVRVRPDAAIDPLREALQAALRAGQRDRLKGLPGLPAFVFERAVNEQLLLRPAGAGVSNLQGNHRESLAAIAVLVALVLLIACVNVANLMTAQAASRSREMALRVSIGAARARLVQLVLVEGAWLALLATIVGAAFAWWSTPFVVSMLNPPENPARLALPADWRVLGFGLALAFGVTCLFGLGPALRASAVKPIRALKGDADPHTSRRVMHILIGAQVAFCVLVQFVAGLFVVSFDRLSHQPNGFSPERVLTVRAIARPAQTYAMWDQVADHLRAQPGVEKVALAGWPLMSGQNWNGFVTVDGTGRSNVLTFFLPVSPGWTATMRIPIVAGRDLRPSDTQPGAALVNETFVKTYFAGEPMPIGRYFEKPESNGSAARYQIVGVVGDARYRPPREAIPPIAYVPLATRPAGIAKMQGSATFILRTSASGPDPLTLAPILRRELPRARPEFRVDTIRTQQSIIDAYTVRERLLATLATFFAAVALLLAAVGLYGVLDYSVLQRQREIGIRLAIGARALDIAKRVTVPAFTVVLTGAAVGIGLGLATVRWIEALFYGVTATDPVMLAVPWLTILAAAFLAALRPVIRAIRVDPVRMLRTD